MVQLLTRSTKKRPGNRSSINQKRPIYPKTIAPSRPRPLLDCQPFLLFHERDHQQESHRHQKEPWPPGLPYRPVLAVRSCAGPDPAKRGTASTTLRPTHTSESSPIKASRQIPIRRRSLPAQPVPPRTKVRPSLRQLFSLPITFWPFSSNRNSTWELAIAGRKRRAGSIAFPRTNIPVASVTRRNHLSCEKQQPLNSDSKRH